jgi:hypothetical protein
MTDVRNARPCGLTQRMCDCFSTIAESSELWGLHPELMIHHPVELPPELVAPPPPPPPPEPEPETPQSVFPGADAMDVDDDMDAGMFFPGLPARRKSKSKGKGKGKSKVRSSPAKAPPPEDPALAPTPAFKPVTIKFKSKKDSVEGRVALNRPRKPVGDMGEPMGGGGGMQPPPPVMREAPAVGAGGGLGEDDLDLDYLFSLPGEDLDLEKQPSLDLQGNM